MATIQILTDSAAATPVTGLQTDLQGLGHTVSIVTAGPYSFASVDLIVYCVTNGATVANSLATAKASGKPILLSIAADGTGTVTTLSAHVQLTLAQSVTAAVTGTTFVQPAFADWINAPQQYTFASMSISSGRRQTAVNTVDTIWSMSPFSSSSTGTLSGSQLMDQAAIWLVPPAYGQSTAWIGALNVASTATSTAAYIVALKSLVTFLLAPKARTFTIKDNSGVDQHAVVDIVDKHGNFIGRSKTITAGSITVPFVCGTDGAFDTYQNIIFKTTDGMSTNSVSVPRPA